MRKLWFALLSAVLIFRAGNQGAAADGAGERKRADMKIQIQVTNESGVTTGLTATLAENPAAAELARKLRESPVALDMTDYGDFEKYGTLPFSLARNDSRITAGCGDIMLAWGNTFAIYYGRNSYSFTRLGFLDAVADGSMTQADLKKALGEGGVRAVISLSENSAAAQSQRAASSSAAR